MIYLRIGGLPEDKDKHKQLCHRARHYMLINDELFRGSANGTLMKCITPNEGCAILQDIHAWICGSHAGAISLVGKTYMQGFFWPTIVFDADSLVHRCEGCQFFACQKHVSSHELQTILITWPFSTWGLDLVGPFKKARGGFTHIFIGMDKCTKWIEVKPAASVIVAKVELIKEILYKFGVPNNIITDNGTQFTAREFKDFCMDSGIKVNYAFVSHMQSNGQVERSNGLILQGLNPRIFDRLTPYARNWVKKLQSVLWALHTTPSHAMCHTPFSLVYGSGAMLPTEVEHKSFRVQQFIQEQSDDSRVDNLTRLEELRKVAVIQSAKHQQAMRRYHTWNVSSRNFHVGDCVLQKIQMTKDRHKLFPI
jgi:hypothetical protein